MSDSNTSSAGMGFLGWLQLTFIVLKLLGKIDWSWWWVLSPIWITVAFALVVFILLVLYNIGSKK